MGYVIFNHTQRKYVAISGSANSFTKDIRRARIFTTREAAKADCCGDESPRDLFELFGMAAPYRAA